MDYLKAAKDKELEWDFLFKRMDKDKDLVNLLRYVLLDAEPDAKPIPHAISVTLNDPAVFATNVEASLGNASEQVVVTSDDPNFDTAYVEDAIKSIFLAVDERLGLRFPFDAFIDQQTCRRGRAVARCLFRIENDRLVPDIMYQDSRFVTYGLDVNGLAWESYKTTRSIDDAENEYHRSFNLPASIKRVDVRDIWTQDHNEIWVNDQLVLELEKGTHTYGEVPVAIKIVPIGSMLMDADSLQYQGESIFLLMRDIIPELNRLASIMQSLTNKELDHALQEKVPQEAMDTTAPVDHDQVTNPRSVTKTIGGFEAVPIGQIREAAISLHQLLEVRMQRGGISNFETGTFNQPMSAVALIKVGQGRDQVFLPRLGTRGLLKQQLAQMALKQIISECHRVNKRSIQIGKKTFEIGKLEADYGIEYRYSIKDTSIDVARQALATSQRGLIPDKSIRRDTLQREDPEGDERQLRYEEAERLFPTIKMYRTVKALTELGERGDEDAELEAEIAAAELGLSLEQVLSGQLQQRAPEPEPKPQQPLIPMFDNNGQKAVPNA